MKRTQTGVITSDRTGSSVYQGTGDGVQPYLWFRLMKRRTRRTLDVLAVLVLLAAGVVMIVRGLEVVGAAPEDDWRRVTATVVANDAEVTGLDEDARKAARFRLAGPGTIYVPYHGDAERAEVAFPADDPSAAVATDTPWHYGWILVGAGFATAALAAFSMVRKNAAERGFVQHTEFLSRYPTEAERAALASLLTDIREVRDIDIEGVPIVH